MGQLNRQEVFEKIAQITLETFELEKEKVALSTDTTFKKDLDADNLDIAVFVLAIEDEFSITLSNKEVEKLTNIESLIELIQSKI